MDSRDQWVVRSNSVLDERPPDFRDQERIRRFDGHAISWHRDDESPAVREDERVTSSASTSHGLSAALASAVAFVNQKVLLLRVMGSAMSSICGTNISLQVKSKESYLHTC